jgi:hypothetical protein
MPVLILAFALILVMGILFATSYFSIIVLVKIFKVLFTTLNSASLPNPVSKSLQEARDYATKIKRTAQQHPPGPIQDRLNRMVQPVDEWLVNLTRLEQSLLKLYGQQNLARELRRVNFEVDQLRRQVLTSSEEEAASLRALLKSKQKHQAILKELQTFQSQTELRIRKIASDLGGTHAEMLLVTARGDFNDNRFKRLDENLQENLRSLRDIVTVMDEMGYSSATS